MIRGFHLTYTKLMWPILICNFLFISVTRIDDFSKVLPANFLTIVAQIFVTFWANLKTSNF